MVILVGTNFALYQTLADHGSLRPLHPPEFPLITPRACARGKVIGCVVIIVVVAFVVVVVSTKIAIFRDNNIIGI